MTPTRFPFPSLSSAPFFFSSTPPFYLSLSSAPSSPSQRLHSISLPLSLSLLPFLLLRNSCVVTDYGLFANGTVSVRNRQRDGSVTGAYNGILGWAGLNNRTGLATSDGSLSVYLQIPPPGPQGIAAPYDIILLGPPTYGPFGLYQYAVVSDPLEVSLFVLTRDVDTFFAQYNATVMETLRKDGFINPINEPRMTIQQGCAEFSDRDLDTCDLHDHT